MYIHPKEKVNLFQNCLFTLTGQKDAIKNALELLANVGTVTVTPVNSKPISTQCSWRVTFDTKAGPVSILKVSISLSIYQSTCLFISLIIIFSSSFLISVAGALKATVYDSTTATPVSATVSGSGIATTAVTTFAKLGGESLCNIMYIRFKSSLVTITE